MGIKTTSATAAIVALISTSAFAGNATNAPVMKSDVTPKAHVVKAPVLLDVSATKTKTLRINRVVIQPVEALVVREASTVDQGTFVYKAEKNTKAKTYHPAVSNKSARMPNRFTK